jgi:hypothetical protein
MPHNEALVIVLPRLFPQFNARQHSVSFVSMVSKANIASALRCSRHVDVVAIDDVGHRLADAFMQHRHPTLPRSPLDLREWLRIAQRQAHLHGFVSLPLVWQRLSATEYANHFLGSMQFATRFETLAAEIRSTLQVQCGFVVGVHGRWEPDMVNHFRKQSRDTKELEDGFFDYLASLKIWQPSCCLYLASGLITEPHRRRLLSSVPCATAVISKSTQLSPQVLAGFSREELAIVDMIVVRSVDVFVGTDVSTFSQVIRIWREINTHGAPTHLHKPVGQATTTLGQATLAIAESQ